MSDGVTDEQRVAAFRDRYGRIAYVAHARHNYPTIADSVIAEWPDLPYWRRDEWGRIAEAVIAAFVAGEVVPPPEPPEGDYL